MRRLLLVALMVLVTLVGMVGFSRAEDKEIQTAIIWQLQDRQTALQELPAAANAGDPAKRRMYYLTATGFTGGEAITACDSGFHMASLFEIQDPSIVQYAPGRKPAYNYSDQGSDQFPDHTGWVRTGGASPLTGFVNNCNFWQSSSDQQGGTTMTRRSLWGENNGHSLYEESSPAAWWQSTRIVSCSQPEFVWCAEDPE